MKRRNTLNNMISDNIRKTQAYQCVLTDLVLAGVIDKHVAEGLLGYEIPDYLHLPAYFNDFCKDTVDETNGLASALEEA